MWCPDDLELQSYYDGELESPKMTAITVHIQNCPGCREKINQLQKIVALIQTALPVTPVPGESDIQTTPLGKRRFMFIAAAVLVILMVLGGWYFSQIQQTDLNPEAEIMMQYMVLHEEDCSE